MNPSPVVAAAPGTTQLSTVVDSYLCSKTSRYFNTSSAKGSQT